MDSGQIEITEMHIAVRNALQPASQIIRLGVSRNEQRSLPREKILLSQQVLKVLTILDTDHNNIVGDIEMFEILHEKRHAIMRLQLYTLVPQHHLNRLGHVTQKPHKDSHLHHLGISHDSHLLGAFHTRRRGMKTHPLLQISNTVSLNQIHTTRRRINY